MSRPSSADEPLTSDQLDVAVAASGVGLWSWDARTDEVTWDEVILRHFGRSPAAAPRSFDEYLELIHPEDRERVRAQVLRALATGEYEDLEHRVLLPDGAVRCFLAKGKAIRDERGHVVQLLGGTIDITAQREAAEALRQSEERYRSVVKVLEEGIVLQARDGQIQACNASAERILGLTADQMMGRTSLDPRWRAIHEDGSPFPGETHPAMVTLRTGEPQSNVVMGVHKPDGTLTWISINSQPLIRPGDETPYAVVTSFFDITARKRAEEDRERLLAKEQAARRRAVFLAEASAILSASLDVRAALGAVARRMVPELADLVAIELPGEDARAGADPPRIVVTAEPELRALYQELVRLSPVAEEDPRAESLQRGPVRFDRIPLMAREQRLGVLVLATRGRTFVADDRALVEELAWRMALGIDNARLYHEMQVALRSREEFVAIASHELRTPLTPILLQSQRLLHLYRDGAAPPRDVVLPKLRVIHRQIERLHRLIEELLDVSRIVGGRLSLAPEALDFSLLLRETMERFSEQLARSRCPVHLRTPDTAPGTWDRTRLEQVVSNLVTNAMKYGGGKPIEIVLEVEPAEVRLSVRDHGIGIAPEDHERIFQRFERAVSERHYGGLGLGLWITREVVEAMGGSIRVSSQPGAGSTFIVTLPRTTAGEMAAE